MLCDMLQPFTPLDAMVSEDAEDAQVPFPPVEAYEEPEATPKPEEGMDNWDLRDQLFGRTVDLTSLLISRYPVTSSWWRRNVVTGSKLARASKYLELARKELEA